MTTNKIILSADDVTAQALVDTIRAAVNGIGKYDAYVTEHNVTREDVKHHALALAVLAYPNDKPIQRVDGKRTRFGNAVQAAGNGLRTALSKVENNGEDPTLNLLTRKGKSASLEEVIAAWEAAQKG